MSAAIPGYTVTCAKHTFEYPTLLLAKACLASWGVQGCVGNNPIAAGLAPKMVWCACSGTVGGHGGASGGGGDGSGCCVFVLQSRWLQSKVHNSAT